VVALAGPAYGEQPPALHARTRYAYAVLRRSPPSRKDVVPGGNTVTTGTNEPPATARSTPNRCSFALVSRHVSLICVAAAASARRSAGADGGAGGGASVRVVRTLLAVEKPAPSLPAGA
jgi:hypothetical protein